MDNLDFSDIANVTKVKIIQQKEKIKMEKQYNPDGFIPKHGGYEKLITYQKVIIYQKGIESTDPEVSANVLIGLVIITTYLLAKQIKTLEKEFLQEGGLRERMSNARINVRKKQ